MSWWISWRLISPSMAASCPGCAFLIIHEGNPSPRKEPVMRRFDGFFIVSLDSLLNEKSCSRLFETRWHSSGVTLMWLNIFRAYSRGCSRCLHVSYSRVFISNRFLTNRSPSTGLLVVIMAHEKKIDSPDIGDGIVWLFGSIPCPLMAWRL